jgi:uncharacterized protein
MYFQYAPHFMPVLSKACQASCNYCFGPNKGSIVSVEQLEQNAKFMIDFVRKNNVPKVDITFHGGEPLLAGFDKWKTILEKLSSELEDKKTKLHVQSNLWNLNEDFCNLFADHQVSLSTSIDGPEEINDLQRGNGYFKNTMGGIELARKNGLSVGCIATFTSKNVHRKTDVFSFFLENRLSFTIHASVAAMGKEQTEFTLPVNQYGDLLCELFDLYVKYRHYISISTFDQMISSVAELQGHVCTFKDCFGLFMAVAPEGDLFPCQRFVGLPEFSLGNSITFNNTGNQQQHPVANLFLKREKEIQTECALCEHYEHCKGGCAYNAWTAKTLKDPSCEAYKQIFSKIKALLIEEMSSPENIEAVASRPFEGKGNPFLRKGKIIELSQKPHPSIQALNAIKIISTIKIAESPDLETARNELSLLNINVTSSYLENLSRSTKTEHKPLNNLYIHLTFMCQLKCSHCYAQSASEHDVFFPADALEKVIDEATELGFRQIVFTGGEPLLHNEIEEILDLLIEYKKKQLKINFILRTNFTIAFTSEQLNKIAHAFHQVVASVDGDKETHEKRRGLDTYDLLIKNLTNYQKQFKEQYTCAELSIAGVMPAKAADETPGIALKKLGKELQIKRVRFRPVLPLGRAAAWDIPPVSEALGSYSETSETLKFGISAIDSCGMGLNLYVEPDGNSFPCYAFHQKTKILGNIIEQGLTSVVRSGLFTSLRKATVDTNPKCKTCKFRYICGGACRAWGGELTQSNLNSPPPECTGLFINAERIYREALDYISV